MSAPKMMTDAELLFWEDMAEHGSDIGEQGARDLLCHITALTAERDSLRAHVEAQDARIKGLEATIACEVSP